MAPVISNNRDVRVQPGGLDPDQFPEKKTACTGQLTWRLPSERIYPLTSIGFSTGGRDGPAGRDSRNGAFKAIGGN
jgi:hypothetical protein